jgi:hypothetical protein
MIRQVNQRKEQFVQQMAIEFFPNRYITFTLETTRYNGPE